MIDTETLFILGAGASCPYGYPTGQGLREYIFKNFPDALGHQLNKANFSDSEKANRIRIAINFANIFKRSSLESIDKFLAWNNEFKDIGKQAIASAILHYEDISRFRENVSEHSNQDWYTLLYRNMTSDLSTPDPLERFPENKVSFITFNYDRSLEHFLYTSLINSSFRQRDEIAINAKKYLPFPIIHMYGQIDKAEWKGGSQYRPGIDYQRVNGLKDNIRVIGERTNGEITEIASLIKKVERIFFLGFGFADENIEALDITRQITTDHNIFSTALGSTEREIKEIRRKVLPSIETHRLRERRMFVHPGNCYSLLRQYL